MKFKLSVLLLTAGVLLAGCASAPVPGNINLIENYQYTVEPEICFFPKDKAKWDGYKISNKDWNKLDYYLKLIFIFECSKELERSKAVIITIKDSNRVLVALNYGLNKINKDLPNTEMSVISFFYDVLQDAKMVKPGKAK